jgi:hypothetical protein
MSAWTKRAGRLAVALLPLTLLAAELLVGLGLELSLFGRLDLLTKLPLVTLLAWAFWVAARRGPPVAQRLDVGDAGLGSDPGADDPLVGRQA